ncbi:MAG TPA: O-antigen ligase family protein [Solirubrobacteraceae bacterium]|nr:O-antigen ligase family protein [Solirubrobacteraceae bacterium]
MMQRALHQGNRSRSVVVLGGGLVMAALVGLAAGRWPAIAVGGAVVFVIAVVMLRDLTTAIVLFTVASFGGVLALGNAATAAKGLGVVLVLAWVADLARRSEGDLRSFLRDHRGLVAAGVALVAWNLLSAVWAQSSSAALLGSSRYLQDLVLFPIVYTGVRRFGHVRAVLAAFVAGAVLAMFYGIATGSTVDGSRLVGAIGDPNETATVLVMASVLALALGIGETRSRLRRWAAFAASIVALYGIVSTASRGGVVALAATAATAIVISGRWRRQIIVATAVAGIVVGGWFLLLAPASSRSHLTSEQSPRTTIWTVAGRTIAANPVVGVGNDNFSIVAPSYLVRPGATTRADDVIIKPDVAHDIYLEVWADTGLIGLILFLCVVLAPLRSAWTAVRLLEKAGRRSDEILVRALIVAIVSLLAAGFFISDEYSKQLFLLLALSTATLATVRAEIIRKLPS